MKGRKPVTFRILVFYKKVFGSKRKKRTIRWLQIAVLSLVVANPYFWKILDWYFKNYGPLEAILTLMAGSKILQEYFSVIRERRLKKQVKRNKTQKS